MGASGRVLFTTGRLVALSRHPPVRLRDVQEARRGRYETGRRCDCSHRSLSRRGTGVKKPISTKDLCHDEMGKKVRKLQLRAAVAKMKLRDLAEDLPGKWTEIEEVAEETSAVFAELDGARRELAAMKKLQ